MTLCASGQGNWCLVPERSPGLSGGKFYQLRGRYGTRPRHLWEVKLHMTTTKWVAIFIGILLAVSMVSLGVAGTSSQSLTPAATTVKIQSVTYWLNSVKHGLNLADPQITMQNTTDVLILQGKGLYNGPKGTNAMMFILDSDSQFVRAQEIPVGKVTTMQSDEPFLFTTPGDYSMQVGIRSPNFTKEDVVTVIIHVI